MKSDYSAIVISRSVMVSVALAMAAACVTEREPSAANDDRGQKRAAFDAANAAFHEALRTNNPDSMFIYVADDVWMMPPGEPVVRGKNAMREWYSGFLSQYRTSSLTFSNREVLVGEDWAVEVGTFEWGLTPAGGGEAVVDKGNYMQVWKLLPEGQWRFAREIWNSPAPPPAAPPEKR